MDAELVSGSESSQSGTGGGQHRPPVPFTFTEKFEELCPFYLSLGMTWEQYWDGDASMTIMFRKAYELKQEQENQRLWLQGAYFYEALCCVAPALRMFKPQKPTPYRSEPIPLTGKREPPERKEDREKKSDQKAKAYMEMFAMSFNKQFEEKGG